MAKKKKQQRRAYVCTDCRTWLAIELRRLADLLEQSRPYLPMLNPGRRTRHIRGTG